MTTTPPGAPAPTPEPKRIADTVLNEFVRLGAPYERDLAARLLWCEAALATAHAAAIRLGVAELRKVRQQLEITARPAEGETVDRLRNFVLSDIEFLDDAIARLESAQAAGGGEPLPSGDEWRERYQQECITSTTAKRERDEARAELKAMHVEIRARHNGYDADARKAMGIKEPASEREALVELLVEGDKLWRSEAPAAANAVAVQAIQNAAQRGNDEFGRGDEWVTNGPRADAEAAWVRVRSRLEPALAALRSPNPNGRPTAEEFSAMHAHAIGAALRSPAPASAAEPDALPSDVLYAYLASKERPAAEMSLDERALMILVRRALATPQPEADANSYKVLEWELLTKSGRRLLDEIEKVRTAARPDSDFEWPLGQYSTETTCDFAARLIARQRGVIESLGKPPAKAEGVTDAAIEAWRKEAVSDGLDEWGCYRLLSREIDDAVKLMRPRADGEAMRQRAERLHKLLVDCGNATDGIVPAQTSDDLLEFVPQEVASMRTQRDGWRSRVIAAETAREQAEAEAKRLREALTMCLDWFGDELGCEEVRAKWKVPVEEPFSTWAEKVCRAALTPPADATKNGGK